MILLDTNVLLRYIDKDKTQHKEVTKKILELLEENSQLVICPQTLYEFYVVATRPKSSNGWGLSQNEAIELLNVLCTTFNLINDNEKVFENWKYLLENYEIMGKVAHDTRLVAFMLTHYISKLYTLNQEDFQRYIPLIKLV